MFPSHHGFMALSFTCWGVPDRAPGPGQGPARARPGTLDPGATLSARSLMRLGPRLGSGLALGSASRLSAWIWLDFGLDFCFGWISARFWFDLILVGF